MFTTALLAVTLAAPVPKWKSFPVYFPTAEGARWVTQVSFGDGVEATFPVCVTRVEVTEGGRLVTTQYGTGREAVKSVYEVSQTGVSVRSTSGGKAIHRFKLGQTPGTTWEAEESVSPTVTRKLTFTAVGEEEVEVPAGRFQALRVDCESEWGGVKQQSSAWYAADVGQVKYVLKANGSTATEVLKEFSPGQDAKK